MNDYPLNPLILSIILKLVHLPNYHIHQTIEGGGVLFVGFKLLTAKITISTQNF